MKPATSVEFEEYTLRCTEGRDVRFTGKLLGQADGTCMIRYKFALYVTLAGSYVCYMEWMPISPAQWRSSAEVCRNEEEVIETFNRLSPLVAKKLYESAGIEDTVDIA